ncbi:ABC transporter ATP-binding protein [Marivita geojedonensis]|uniref:Multidrug ABC transporter ATP-binding protein n=1 Tax=Marivita geojedonensis TaxID=1123756 RepID=A0A1X4NJX5_9RHOB|nr:ABC transporter ATP-binding protein [Marivita geojedonensis]OSQ49883.1 multidrug ABC transporter ATP-binding protein [Marivita geojedonensis]PRY76109.1 ATP-binding cassette subfamily B protein [Marivita geojedonensis]
MKLFRIDPFAEADGPPPKTLGAFFRWALKDSGPVLWLAGILSVLGGVAEVVAAILLGRVIDSALDADSATVFSDSSGLLILCLIFFLLFRPIVMGLSAYSQNIMMQPNIMNLVLSRIHRYTLGQSVTFFDNDFAGRIAQKEMQTARALNDVVTEVVHTVLFAVASVVGAILLLGTVDWRIAAGLGVWMIAYGFLIRFFMPRIRKRSKARAGARAMVTGQVVDTVTNIKTVKLFAHQGFEDRAALGAMSEYRKRFLDFSAVSVAFRFWLMALAGILPVLLVGGALWYWSLGLISAGDIAATGAISLRLAQMTGWVSFTLMSLYSNVGEVEDGMRTLTPDHTLVDRTGATDLKVSRGEVRLDCVSFAYGKKKGGVEDISLTIHPGEKLAIVGASGAGKSTLVSLLLRLYDAEKGTIRIDGQNVSDVTQESLRRQIGMVTQETAMFNRSALDNIRYGRPDASKDEVIAAARKAEAHEFIKDLEDHLGRTGYDAHLGERGVKLSGGQRQRIALARAILKDAPILVLDEATSALDSEVEAQIQSALERVMDGKTVLAIAHRLSTIASMDRIVVMDQGHIAEVGTHDALLAKGGLYARYWDRQSGGFIGAQAAE